ncbi:MAG TPA: FAD:protein FMN transferase [Acidimicrobiia bacterium]|nr:FAD:protein FMN transferase [Acidimicrobiia bacterium]
MADALPVHELRRRAMGADAHLLIAGPASLVDGASARLDELEGRWSRFIESSEVCAINARAGRDVVVSTDTQLLFARAIEAWRLTGGTFDPTVLGDLWRAGYDRSFDGLTGAERPNSLHRGAAGIVCRDGTVRVPGGIGFDPGGIGKGLAADIVARETINAGASAACINLGGDLRAIGQHPQHGGWTIAIEHPHHAEAIATVAIGEGAVATSTTLRREWIADGKARHHLIDPRTGEPAATDIDLVTVIAGDAWIAEVLAKAELLRGTERLFDLVGGTGAEALAVTTDGRILTTNGFARFVLEVHSSRTDFVGSSH